jgi:hypothetical protein
LRRAVRLELFEDRGVGGGSRRVEVAVGVWSDVGGKVKRVRRRRGKIGIKGGEDAGGISHVGREESREHAGGGKEEKESASRVADEEKKGAEPTRLRGRNGSRCCFESS